MELAETQVVTIRDRYTNIDTTPACNLDVDVTPHISRSGASFMSFGAATYRLLGLEVSSVSAYQTTEQTVYY